MRSLSGVQRGARFVAAEKRLEGFAGVENEMSAHAVGQEAHFHFAAAAADALNIRFQCVQVELVQERKYTGCSLLSESAKRSIGTRLPCRSLQA